MKTIPTVKPRNKLTQDTIDELAAWLGEYITDETEAFAIVAVSKGGSGVNVDYKNACGGAVPRPMLAKLAFGAIVGDQPEPIDGAAFAVLPYKWSV